MKVNTSKMWRSGIAMLLALCLVVGFFPTAAFAVETEETLHYVSLGASNTNGYGLDGYLPADVYEDPLAASKADMNVYGYDRAPEDAYPKKVELALEAKTGKEVELHQLAISSMRVEEVRYLLDDTMAPDAYMEWRFTDGEKWFEIAEPGGINKLKAAYRDFLTDANYVTVDLGWNNFGVFAFNNIKTILADGNYWKAPDFSYYEDKITEDEYNSIRNKVLEKLTANMSGADESLKAKMNLMADVLAAATMGACYNYDIVMEKIYELNPDVTVAVINIQNLADDLVVTFEGTELALGDLYGELIDLVNLYRASESPYADKIVYVDAGDVTTFLDELVAWNGDPATLSGDTKDCFDMYDDGLYVRSIVEYMLAGQALSTVFAMVRGEAGAAGLTVFADDDNYTYDFALTRTPEQLLALDLGKLDLNNPAGEDADVEVYGKALAPHLKNLRAQDFDAYDYVFTNLKAALPEVYHETVDGIQQQFKAALAAVYTTYVNTLNYAYDVVTTFVQYVAKTDTLEISADSLNGFNSAADGLMNIVFNDVINGAMNKFYYELYANGLSADPAPAVPEYEVDKSVFENNPALCAIAVLAVRYELGNSFFAHPNPTGHDEITDAVMNALNNGSDAEDFTGIKVGLYTKLLKEKYPNLYKLITGAQNVGEMDDLAIIIAMMKMSGNPALKAEDLDALEAEIRASVADYAEGKTPEQLEKAQDVVYDLMKRLYDLAAIASGSDYKVTEDSYYVSLGDSTITGYGLDGYRDNVLNGAGQAVEGSAHVLLAQHLYGDSWKNHFGLFTQGALRADDLLLFLGGEVETDDYYDQEIETNLMEGTLEATQAKFIENVKKADLISVAIGGGNVFTFVGKQMNRVMGTDPNPVLKLDWERIGMDAATMKELNEVLDLMVPIIDELGLMDQYVPEDMGTLEEPAKFARALAESLLYGYASYNYYYPQVLAKIKEINPDAQLLVLGMFNPVDDWSMTTTIDGQETYVPIGGAIGNLIGSANLQNLAFALQNDNAIFVDVTDTETILEAEKPGELTFNDYYDGSLKSNGKSVHASVAGHKYIFNQMAATLNKETQIRIILKELYDLLVTYGPDVAEEVWRQWNEYGYVAAVEETIDELKAVVMNRYNLIMEETLPVINTAIDALNTEKDALVAELDQLNVQLAKKKAELEAVINGIEIGSIHVPEINIDAIGGNEQTEVPAYDCEVDGEGVVAELEAAIRDLEHAIAVIEALITDVDADLADMAKMAAQIAAAAEELSKTFADITAAAEELYDAFEAIEEVLTADADMTVAAVVEAYEAARKTALAAVDVLEIAMDAASEIDDDILKMVDIIVEDAKALYKKFITELPGCIEQIPPIVLYGSAYLLNEAVTQAKEELPGKIEELKAETRKEIEALIEEYGPQIEQAEKDLEAKWESEIEPAIREEYEKVSAEIEAEYEAAIAALTAKKAALEAELDAAKEALKNAAKDAVAPLLAQIERLEKDIATVTADLAHAAGHLDTALKLAYEEVKIAVMALYNETMAQLNAAIEALKAQLEKAIEDLIAAIEAMIEKAIQDALAEILAAVEDMKNALIAMGIETLEELVDALVALFNELLYKATHADLVIDHDFKYVALGDGSAVAYAEALNAYLAAEAAENGINSIDFVNEAEVGNSIAAEAANLSAEIADADLITLGFSQTDMLANAITAGELDWAALIGAEAVPYVEEALAKVAAEIDALELPAEMKEMLKAVVEAYAYNVVEYAINLPALVYAIREANEDAVVIVVGMYNPIDGVTALGQDLSAFAEYFDYLIEAADAYGIGLAMLTNELDYVTASEVEIEKTQLGLGDLGDLLEGDLSAMYPSANGDAYIAERIENALNLIFTGLWGDANGDGVVLANDAMLVLQYSVGLITADKLNLAVCDVNGDGDVLANDAMLILQYSVGLITAFPVEG